MFRKMLDVVGAALLGAVVLLIVLAIVLMIRWVPELWNEKAAGWAQAIGAFVAIIGAFAVVNHQTRLTLIAQAEKERQDTEKFLRNIYEIISQGAFFVIQAYEFRMTEQKGVEFPDTPDYRESELERLTDMRSALMDIPLHAVGNIDAVQAVIAMRRLLGDCIRAVRNIKGYGSCGPNSFLEELNEMYDRALTIHESIGHAYDEAVKWP